MLKVGIVVPHMFMHRDILPGVIFSPAKLAIDLANGLSNNACETYLYTPGPIKTKAFNIQSDLSLFRSELRRRDYDYIELLKRHPQIFISLSRQVQSEIIARSFKDANEGKLDIVHVYTNEEEIAMVFSSLCNKPVVFTHHDPFSYLIKYKTIMPKYRHLPWISMSLAQRKNMPKETNWVANIYHGIPKNAIKPLESPSLSYVAYIGRIIDPKGVHLAIEAINKYNNRNSKKLSLRIAGKHYSGHAKEDYWERKIQPFIDNKSIIYDGFISDLSKKNDFLANAKALIVPSLFDEPFGMVSIEAMAAGTPVIALNSGALPEIIKNGNNGFIVRKRYNNDNLDEDKTAEAISIALDKIGDINRSTCREIFVNKFTIDNMVNNHIGLYKQLVKMSKL